MTALALVVVFCWLATIMLTVSGCLRAFRDGPPTMNSDENKRRMAEALHAQWGQHLRALGFVQGAAAVLLAIVVLLG